MLVRMLAGLIGLAMGSAALAQQSFPIQPIHFIVHFPAGGASDTLSRTVAQRMSADLGQPVVVDNRPGGAGNIGLSAIARSTPDGYTIGLGSMSSLAINPSLYKNLNFDVARDLTPVGMMAELDAILVVPADLPVDDLAGLAAFARSHPDAMNYGSNGVGSSPQIQAELLKRALHFPAIHVPFGGDAPILNALMAGQIQMSFMAEPAVTAFVKAGKLKALATTGARRDPLAPQAAPLVDLGQPGLTEGTWFAIVAPFATPQPIRDRLSASIAHALASPETKAAFNALGAEPSTMPAAAIPAFVKAQQSKWSDAVEATGVHVD